MRIFITGATGYVGGAVAAALHDRGHEVTALVRPESEAKELRERGVVMVVGDLSTLPSLTGTLAGHDAFVHTAFSMQDTVAHDRMAVESFTKQKGFFVFTSGVWVLGNSKERALDETSPVNPLSLVAWRPKHEQMALANGRGAVLRPGCVYGGKQSLLAAWFAAADQHQPLHVMGDGNNHWAMVNVHDLADCYVRLVEKRATGTFHGVDETRATVDECARAVAPSGKIDHLPAGGPMAEALTIDQQVSSDATRRKLGWTPRRTFVTSIEEQWREWRAG